MFLLLFALLVVCYSTTGTGASPLNEGEAVRKPSEYPFVVRMKISNVTIKHYGDIYTIERICGGIIVKPDTILTAAHCLCGSLSTVNIKVVAGIIDLKNETDGSAQIVSARAYKVHENFVENSKINSDDILDYSSDDVGIVWVTQPFNYTSFVNEATLNYAYINLDYELGKIVGWSSDGHRNKSVTLHYGDVRIMPLSVCNQYYNRRFGNKTLCVQSAHTYPCTKDAGGPLVYKNSVVAIISRVKTETIKDSTGKISSKCSPANLILLTRIDYYAEWIQKYLHSGPPKRLTKGS